MILPVVEVFGWFEVGFGGLPCGRGSPTACMDSRAGGPSLEQGSMGDELW